MISLIRSGVRMRWLPATGGAASENRKTTESRGPDSCVVTQTVRAPKRMASSIKRIPNLANLAWYAIFIISLPPPDNETMKLPPFLTFLTILGVKGQQHEYLGINVTTAVSYYHPRSSSVWYWKMRTTAAYVPILLEHVRYAHNNLDLFASQAAQINRLLSTT
jgi:hypothetical protein